MLYINVRENRRVIKHEQKTEGSSKMSRKQKGHKKLAENRRVIKNEQETEGSSKMSRKQKGHQK
jgi:hypothetical protein